MARDWIGGCGRNQTGFAAGAVAGGAIRAGGTLPAPRGRLLTWPEEEIQCAEGPMP